MADFELSIKKILFLEGKYFKDSDDYGGETKYGISKRQYPEYDIKSLTIEQAKEIYKKDYWNKLRLDEIKDQKIAEEMLDIAVNCGWQTAGKFVQETINLLVAFQPLKVDGFVGEKTLTAINSYSHPNAIVKVLNGMQFERYREIVKRDSSQQKWFRGWLARVEFA